MRLIDADELDRIMYHKAFEVDDGRNVWNSGLWIRYKIYEEANREAKTVDAVEVIRCKDCQFYKEENLQCMNHEGDSEEWYENDFCSRGERSKE